MSEANRMDERGLLSSEIGEMYDPWCDDEDLSDVDYRELKEDRLSEWLAKQG